MRDTAIRKIFYNLESLGIKLGQKELLAAFARDGSWQTSFMASLVEKVTAWEIDENFEKDLRNNLPPNAEIIIGDSFRLIHEEKKKFDIIVFDNPMACFGKNREYSEHFDIIRNFKLVSKSEVVLIFNVKTRPFNYKKNLEWQKRREEFYKNKETSDLGLPFLKNFYIDLFLKEGYETAHLFIEKRPQETGLYQFCFIMGRINSV